MGRHNRNKEDLAELYGLNETPVEIYDSFLRLEGNSRAPDKDTPYEEDEARVREHIKNKCEEIKNRKTEMDIHPTEVSYKNRLSDVHAERGAYLEQEIRRLSG